MRITLVAVGRLKEQYWRSAAEEYLKRLKPYARVDVVEISDRDSSRDEARAKAEEGADILKALPDGAHVVVLAIDGRQRSSEAFAAHLERMGVEGTSSVAFVIGGSVGLADEVIRRADETLSFGPMTLPHNLAQIVLLEQVYRAFRIIRNEPYHK